MTTKIIILLALLYVTCNGYIADDVLSEITTTVTGLPNGLPEDDIIDFSEFENFGDITKAFNQVPLLHSARSSRSVDHPEFNSDISTRKFIHKIFDDYRAGQSNGDINLNIEELVVKYGHRIEKHAVTTEDGYVLSLFRIPNNGPAVFLMHGLLGSADDYVVAGPESGLAYLLADEGYDVWMGNARGNKHSRRHSRLSTSDASFWDFSFHEIGVYDLPAMIDYVLKETNQKSIKYVGHSQGTTSFFVMASERPKYNKKISLMVALSPVAFMSHAKSPFMKLSLGVRVIGGILKVIGHREFLPDSNKIQKLKNLMCGTGLLAELFCTNIMFLAFGFDLGQVNVTNLPVLLSHIPSGASTKQFVHFAQGAMSGSFRKYDYGFLGNRKTYGKWSPPSYDLSNIAAPVALFYSDNDWLAHPTDVKKLYYKLNNVVEVYKIPYKKFNHVDFLFGKDVKTLIFKKLRELLLSY